MNAQKTLTNQMIKRLCECYNSEVEGKPANFGNTNYCAALLRRGLVEIRPYDNKGKLKDALFITPEGKEVLQPFMRTSGL